MRPQTCRHFEVVQTRRVEVGSAETTLSRHVHVIAHKAGYYSLLLNVTRDQA